MALSWLDVLGRIAPAASLAVFLAPLPTLQEIQRTRTVGHLPLLPYTTMILSAYLWCLYGLLRYEPAVWMTNALGMGFGAYYFGTFVRYVPSRGAAPTLPGRVAQHQQGIGLVVVLTGLLVLSRSPAATSIIGTAAVTLCLAMFGSPLAALRTVLRTKSAAAIPWPFTVASLVNCFCWTVFGFFTMRDPAVYLTNALGLMFGVAQAALKIIYPSTTTAQSNINE